MTVHARLGAEIETNVDAWVEQIVSRVRHEVPTLVRDDMTTELGLSSSRALMLEFAATLREGDLRSAFRAPASALGFARHLARSGASLAGLLRSYRLGQELLFDRAASLADAQDTEGLRRVGLLAFKFVDAVANEVTDAFERERESSLRSAQLRRERVMERLMSGEVVTRDRAETDLGWRLGGAQVAVVAWATSGNVDVEAVTSAVRVVLAWLGDGRTLVMPGAAGDVHAWTVPVSSDIRTPPDAVIRALESAHVRVAIGEPGRDLVGFLNTRRQADAARRVGRYLAEPVVRYADVALVHVLLADPLAAQSFARNELGRLARPEHADLRRTVLTYLEAGRDTTACAEALGFHRNTVMRRIRRAEELVGHRLRERSTELAAALRVSNTVR